MWRNGYKDIWRGDVWDFQASLAVPAEAIFFYRHTLTFLQFLRFFFEIFKIAKKFKSENSDVVGDKCVRDNSGLISYTDTAKLAAWKQHYEQLLNEEFPWDANSLSPAPPVEGPAIYLPVSMVNEVRLKQKINKAPGISRLCAEMINALGEIR